MTLLDVAPLRVQGGRPARRPAAAAAFAQRRHAVGKDKHARADDRGREEERGEVVAAAGAAGVGAHLGPVEDEPEDEEAGD